MQQANEDAETLLDYQKKMCKDLSYLLHHIGRGEQRIAQQGTAERLPYQNSRGFQLGT